MIFLRSIYLKMIEQVYIIAIVLKIYKQKEWSGMVNALLP